MPARKNSASILEHNRKFIPGGVVSINRATLPEIVFEKGQGQYIWDVEGNRYLDYHAAFAPHLLGHNDSYVNEQVIRTMRLGASLYGTGTTTLEGRLAELMCQHVPCVESVLFLNSGSEATYQAIRLARAVTGKDHLIVIQGGYNGWHNDVSCNLMSPIEKVGPRVSPGEYPYDPLSAGIPAEHRKLVHIINFNDIESARYLCEQFPIAALITEPILQNIGMVKPLPGYLKELRALADQFGFLLIFDEVKTGFRHALGGYAALSGVRPDLATYGKALANGYPIAAIGGKKEFMDYFAHPDLAKRVLLAGTYNAHPISCVAAIATIERLLMNGGEVYVQLEKMGDRLQEGLEGILSKLPRKSVVCRQGSALCIYFADHAPRDWHDLVCSHDFGFDLRMRRKLVDRLIYVFPTAVKQWSICSSHTMEDIELTLHEVETVLNSES